MPTLGARGLAYIALFEAPQPLDQTDIDLRLIFILKGDGGMIRKTEPDWLCRWGGRPHPLGGRLASGPILCLVCFPSLLVPFRLQKSCV
jgi:hypothetical protein